MVAIITEKFKLHNASQFVESFTEAAASTYYLFIGKGTAFTAANDGTGASDTSPPLLQTVYQMSSIFGIK